VLDRQWLAKVQDDFKKGGIVPSHEHRFDIAQSKLREIDGIGLIPPNRMRGGKPTAHHKIQSENCYTSSFDRNII
jgi:hypothetical protein